MQIMNQIRIAVLVHLEIDRVIKILKNRKKDDKVLDYLENEIHKHGSNSSETSPNKPKLIKVFKKGKGKKNLHYEKHTLNFDMDTFKNMVPLPEMQIFTENNSSNEGKKYPYRFMGFIGMMSSFDDDDIKIEPFTSTTNQDSSETGENMLNDASLNSITDSIGLTFDSNSGTNLTSVLQIDDNDVKIEPFISTTYESSSEIIQQEALIIVKCEPLLESIKLNISNSASMDESNICKELIQTDFSEKMLNDTSSSSIINLIDLTLDSSSGTKYTSVSHSMADEKFDYTKNEKYVSLKIIVFNNINYKTYHKQIMIKLAKKLKKNQLLWKFQDAWHSPEANLVKIILEDILKLINHMENKNIIFMGCLSIIFRKTVVSHFNVTDTDLYNHFTLFTNVIEKCLMNINDHFWRTMFPNGWNKFCNGCLIVDLIIHGPSMSMDKYVNWNEIPSTQKFHNNLNIQSHLNKPSVFNNQLEKPPSDNSFMPSIFDMPSNNNTVTSNDREYVIRKRSSDILSMPTSNKSTEKLPQTKDEKLAKRKKIENTSFIPSIFDIPTI